MIREVGGEVNSSLEHSNTIKLTPSLCRADGKKWIREKKRKGGGGGRGRRGGRGRGEEKGRSSK